jgi:diaminopimelate decarboxylase
LNGSPLDVMAGYAKRFGSPAYVYDIAQVRASHALLRAAVPESVEIAYSLKANPHPALVQTLGELGCALEVSSVGELAVASRAGRSLIFTGPGKSDLDLEAAIRAGCVLSLESPAELPRVAEVAGRLGLDAGGVQVILRINPDSGLESSGISMAGETQFGFSAANSQAWRTELARTSANAVGYHVYGGSNLPGVDGLVKYFHAALECIATVNRVVGLDIQLVNLGGGFPAPYASPGVNIELTGLREALETLLGTGSGRPRVVVESGRYLSATSGTLLATVRDIKSAASGTRFVVLDAGVNHLGGMSALRRIPPVVAVPVTSAGDGSPDRPARLVGPLCTPLDVLNLRAVLPDRLAIGDVMAIPNVGAYGLTASLLGFLSRDLPCEIVVDGERLIEATRLTLTRAACEEP